MELTATLLRSLKADLQAQLQELELAVENGTREAGRGLKTELRRQVGSAGLGQRLANSWRDRHYPNQKLDAAGLVCTKAPQIIRAFDEGVLIRRRRGWFLGIPTGNAPRKAPTANASARAHFRSTGSAAAVRASIERTVAPGRGRAPSLVQPPHWRPARVPARNGSSPAEARRHIWRVRGTHSPALEQAVDVGTPAQQTPGGAPVPGSRIR
jgi:hypothetical protein